MFPNKAAAGEMPSRTFVVRRGIERSDNDVGGDFHEPSRLRKNYVGTPERRWSARVAQARSVWLSGLSGPSG